jgi:hypothetical protein
LYGQLEVNEENASKMNRKENRCEEDENRESEELK